MVLRLTFRQRRVGRDIRLRMTQEGRRVRRAERLSAQDARDEMVRVGREDISRSGNFGRRWTEGLNGEVTQSSNATTINLTHDVPYFPVHQFGAHIRGRPLLWIPLSHAEDAQGVSARDFPGALFRVDREGKAPLLLAVNDREPKYSGHESVDIPKRFHVLEKAREIALRIGDFFRKRMAEQ